MRHLIFDPAEHELLGRAVWNEGAARTFIARTVHEADESFGSDETWPLHPEDRYDAQSRPGRGLYFGAAGTMWALTRLATQFGLPLRDYRAPLARCALRYNADPAESLGAAVPSYMVGIVGILTAQYAIGADASVLDMLAAEIASNVENPAQEAFWGASGSIVPALILREAGDRRFDELIQATQNALWKTWNPHSLLWEQLLGRRAYYVGAGHGAAGNLAPFIRALDLLDAGRRAQLRERVVTLLERYAIHEGDETNWYSLGKPRSGNRLQWCHGGPGVIIALARYPNDDERVERLLVAAGECIWHAGPLRKGPTLCHGTAGNGFALLRLAARTGEERWQRRAEAFAAHAMQQVDNWRAEFGMASFSLWTGELGVALFVDAVLRKDPTLLTLDSL